MSETKTVRAPLIEFLLGVFFFAASVFEFVMGFRTEDNVTNRNSNITYGILGLVIAILLILVYFISKYEYDDNGFTYTSIFGKKRYVAYNDLFDVMYTNKNSLRLETKDGFSTSISINSKAAKEFAQVIIDHYKEQISQSGITVTVQNAER